MPKTINHPRHSERMNTKVSDEFTRPSTQLELAQEYEPFSSTSEAVKWIETTARLFGENHASVTGVVGSVKETDRASTQIADRLRTFGINAQYTNKNHYHYLADDRGGQDRTSIHSTGSWEASFDLTDGPGTSGGIYRFHSWSTHTNTPQESKPTPSNGTYEIEYITEDDSGYGIKAGAKFSIGKDAKEMNVEDETRFLNLASHFRSVLVSKLAMLDSGIYKDLEKIIDYNN